MVPRDGTEVFPKTRINIEHLPLICLAFRYIVRYIGSITGIYRETHG